MRRQARVLRGLSGRPAGRSAGRARVVLGVLTLAATLGGAPAAYGHGGEAGIATSPSFDATAALTRSRDTIGRVVRDATFTTADGRTARLSDFRGKPVVVSMIYTACYHVCPTTTVHLARVVRAARDALGPASFTVLTVGFDATNDTPAAMRAFARQQNVQLDHWEFLSADSATIARLAEDLGFAYVRTVSGFDHLLQATVLDGDGRVYRQVYGMTFAIPLLVEPLKELVYATPATASLLANVANRVRLFCTVYDPANDRYRFDYSIFLGIAIGMVSLAFFSLLLIREWRRPKLKPD